MSSISDAWPIISENSCLFSGSGDQSFLRCSGYPTVKVYSYAVPLCGLIRSMFDLGSLYHAILADVLDRNVFIICYCFLCVVLFDIELVFAHLHPDDWSRRLLVLTMGFVIFL